MPYIKTPRLVLRNLQPKDLNALLAYRNDEVCGKYQRWENSDPVFLESFIRRFGNDSFPPQQEEQHYAIAGMEGELVGDLSCFVTRADNCITLGITIAPAYHRQGYAFEMLSEVVNHLRVHNPAMDIVALIDPENWKCIALFQKLGFAQECYVPSISSYIYTLFATKEEIL